MQLTFHLVFLILALICFIAATFGASHPRVSLVPLGLVFLTCALIF